MNCCHGNGVTAKDSDFVHKAVSLQTSHTTSVSRDVNISKNQNEYSSLNKYRYMYGGLKVTRRF